MNKIPEGIDEFQLSDDGGQTWRAATKAEYLAAQAAVGYAKRSGEPILSFRGGITGSAGRMWPLTKPGVEVVNFAEVEINPAA